MKKYLLSSLFLVFTFFLVTDQTLARGGCFGPDTLIRVAHGDISISKLHTGDAIVGYDFTTNKKTFSTISEIDVYDRDEYYLLNDSIRVTAEHPFYVIESGKTIIREVAWLRIGDMMIDENGKTTELKHIKKIHSPIKVYNLLNVEPTHNYYADHVLVHNKGGGGGGGGSSSRSSSRTLTPAELAAQAALRAKIDQEIQTKLSNVRGSWNPFLWVGAIGGILFALSQDSGYLGVMIMVVIFSLIGIKTAIDRITLMNKIFTTDSKLLSFTQAIVPGFIGKYSPTYTKDNESWGHNSLKEELSSSEYAPFAKSDLINTVTSIFHQYESDWTTKNWEGMKSYLTPDYFKQQKDLFDADFGNNFDINYDPQIDAIVPITKLRNDDLTIVFQINANMINFELSPDGKVMSGTPNRRSFTDYWTLTYDTSNNKWLIYWIKQG